MHLVFVAVDQEVVSQILPSVNVDPTLLTKPVGVASEAAKLSPKIVIYAVGSDAVVYRAGSSGGLFESEWYVTTGGSKLIPLCLVPTTALTVTAVLIFHPNEWGWVHLI
jgi:hypothetical protein